VESLEPAVVESHISRKTSEIWGTQDLFGVCENSKKKPQISPLSCAPIEMTNLLRVVKNASVQQPLSIEPLPFPLSSRAKPRDLQFASVAAKAHPKPA
jgi:hypothetical protein